MAQLQAVEFELLLRHLGSTRDEAGVRYEQLRQRLVSTFRYRRCAEPERLADETLDRVARRLQDPAVTSGDGADLAAFAYGIAWNVAREAFRSMRTVPLDGGRDVAPRRSTDAADDERRQLCLDRCLARLGDADRNLIMAYFEKEKRDKIRHRALLAERLRISITALRLRVFRVTSQLRPCVVGCVETSDMSDNVMANG
jgi:hypothetical protein